MPQPKMPQPDIPQQSMMNEALQHLVPSAPLRLSCRSLLTSWPCTLMCRNLLGIQPGLYTRFTKRMDKFSPKFSFSSMTNLVSLRKIGSLGCLHFELLLVYEEAMEAHGHPLRHRHLCHRYAGHRLGIIHL